MKFDEIYDCIGSFGAFQCCFYVSIFVVNLVLNDPITLIFADARVPHFCRVPQLTNVSHSMQKYIAIPYMSEGRSNGQPRRYSACEMYAFNYSAFHSDDFLNWNRSQRTKNTTPTVSCSDWVYDRSTFDSTTVARFALFCSSDNLVPLISSVHMAGFLMGGTLFSTISDRFGRKRALTVFMFVRLLGMSLSSIGVHYVAVVVGRFVIGVGVAGVLLSISVIAMETVPLRQRSMMVAGMATAHSSGFLLHELIAYFVRHDLRYQWTILLPNAFAFGVIFILPESLRWLILKQRYEEANALIDRIVGINRRECPPKKIDTRNIQTVKRSEQRTASRVENVGSFALLRNPRLRIRTAISNFIWFTSSLTFFGLLLNVGTFAGDIFFNTAVSASLEIPGRIVSTLLVESKLLGRRLTCVGLFLFAAAACFVCIPFISHDLGLASTAVSLAGKTFATMSISVVYIFITELFPTEVRSVVMGTCSISSRLGGMVAPYMGAPLMRLWRPLPYLVYGVLSATAGLLTLLLPETLGLPLMDTVDQMEQLSVNRKTFDFFNGSAKKSTEADDDSTPPSNCGGGDGFQSSALERRPNRSLKVTAASAVASSAPSDDSAAEVTLNGATVTHRHAEKDKRSTRPTTTLRKGAAEEGQSAGGESAEGRTGDQMEAACRSPATVFGSILAVDSFVMDENFITHL